MRLHGEWFKWLSGTRISTVICALLVALAQAPAQGTFEYTAHLTMPNPETYIYTGDGVFTLSSNYFHYELLTDYGFFDGQIRSPWPDTNAASVLSLNLVAARAPGPLPNADPGYCLFRGHALLSDDQMAQLENGRWYAWAGADPFYMSGQIVPTPEPGSASLVITGIIFLALTWRTRRGSRDGTKPSLSE
jgi:hypothetical protein